MGYSRNKRGKVCTPLCEHLQHTERVPVSRPSPSLLKVWVRPDCPFQPKKGVDGKSEEGPPQDLGRSGRRSNRIPHPTVGV